MHTFDQFIDKFPPVSMPVTLGEDTHFTFSAVNDPLPLSMIHQFILPLDSSGENEYTEYIPCFAIDGIDNFHAIVWWKADLLDYTYTLATFSLKGELIDKKIIAFTKVTQNTIHRKVTSIDEDWNIFMAEGASDGLSDVFEPSKSKTSNYEIMVNGEIVDG